MKCFEVVKVYDDSNDVEERYHHRHVVVIFFFFFSFFFFFFFFFFFSSSSSSSSSFFVFLNVFLKSPEGNGAGADCSCCSCCCCSCCSRSRWWVLAAAASMTLWSIGRRAMRGRPGQVSLLFSLDFLFLKREENPKNYLGFFLSLKRYILGTFPLLT